MTFEIRFGTTRIGYCFADDLHVVRPRQEDFLRAAGALEDEFFLSACLE